jgi:hypothetical protein
MANVEVKKGNQQGGETNAQQGSGAQGTGEQLKSAGGSK